MHERDIHLYVSDILESIQKILSYTRGMSYQDFCEDSRTIDAVVRNFEIIGEAANQIPDSV